MSVRVESTHPSAVGSAVAISASGRWWVSAGTNEAQIWRDGALAHEVGPTGYVSGPPTFDLSERAVSLGGWSFELDNGEATRRWSEPLWLVDGLGDDAGDASYASFGTPFVADVPGTDLVVVRSGYQPSRSRGDTGGYDGPPGQLLLVSLRDQQLRGVLLASADETVRAIAASSSMIAAAIDDQVMAWTSSGAAIHRQPGDAAATSSSTRPALLPLGGPAPAASILSLALRPHGGDVVTVDERGGATITTSHGKQVVAWQPHPARATAVCWSGDGSWVATGAVDGTVRIWSVDGSSVAQIGEHVGDPVASLAANADGTLLLVGGDVVHRGLTVLSVEV